MLNIKTLIGAKYAKNFLEEIKKCAIVDTEESKMRLKLIGLTNKIYRSKNSSKSTK
jgi:hypothetical protein